jgi:hypothetical protein
MRRAIVLLSSLMLSVTSSALAESVPLDARASAVVLEFWQSLKANDGNDEKLIAADATFAMMELGGPYNRAIMSAMADSCQLVALLGSNSQNADDPTSYVWSLVECPGEGAVETVPVGFGVKDGKITQISVDLLTPISIDRSSLDRRPNQ